MAKLFKDKLNKELGLVDVFVLSTGAMFSSGFFLLPGLAAFHTGSSVFVSYFVAALLIMPAMFSIAELSTALPRAGGVYFMLDRSLGPMMGTVGGIGTFLALVLKTAFALVGIGAYASIFYDLPIKIVASLLTIVFMVLNLLGAKKTAGLQRFLVFFLIAVLVLFMVEGLREVFSIGAQNLVDTKLRPFATDGIEGILSTAGFVFVAYLGLTQVASVAEEIKNPERNIPLGMILSLIVTTVIYVVGVFIMVGVLPTVDFFKDLTPVWTASQAVFKWIPAKYGGLLVVAAAIAAFASTGNGGLMSASRYPMAMARDRVIPRFFTRLNSFKTPIYSILATSALMLFFILVLSEEGIAKMASAFQLVIFILVNFAVIVMRNSRIQSYDPGYHSPLFPWMQIFGILTSLLLIIYMGWGPAIFTMGVVVFAMIWYYYYTRKYVKREGAIYHWFALLGQKQHIGLENEFLFILKEKGLREGDPFDEMVVQAEITQLKERVVSFNSLVGHVSESMANKLDRFSAKDIKQELLEVTAIDPALVIPRVSILHGKFEGIDTPLLHIVTSEVGVEKPVEKGEISSKDNIRVFFLLLSPIDNPKLQLRLLSRIMDIVEREKFVETICDISNEREIKEYLLHNDRYITLELIGDSSTEDLIGKMLKEVRFPHDVLVAMVQRKEKIITPKGDTELEEGDIITIIGEPKGIKSLFMKYIHLNN
ncbi:MAG: amino acid permease [Tenuifilaceae bacterium]|jgi:amino acid transporter/mannitol/fructose-specific phosphotransferase system IIA component (Ntr-type)|uniref:amino acid permease n=1 Tax=Perlabentimonas gracilis TaxID=2715279 RepID=UPI0014073C3E|nr:amino acid permease [Perlabentimonas gracilis]MDX9771361.1 amino acid permease [Tenuifilaceae bacterium]NHB69051.1 amino acid permease [Perlabentimonas gracilis]